jgi:flagellar motility protein MotE (MotC chaperone)
MSERKSSLIIAAMAPERARLVTQMLAQQKAMPEIPGQ